jgi:hypothetical protein
MEVVGLNVDRLDDISDSSITGCANDLGFLGKFPAEGMLAASASND